MTVAEGEMMLQVISGTCYEHGPWTGPGMCPKCQQMTVTFPPTYEEGFAAGYAAALEAAAKACQAEVDAAKRSKLASCATGAGGCLAAIRALIPEAK